MGKVSFGRNNSPKTIQRVPTVENPIITDKVIEAGPSTVTTIQEVIKHIEVPVDRIVERIITIEKPIEVIKEVIVEKIVEVPVVVTKIEIVEIEKPVEVIVEKVTTVLDTALLFEEKQRSQKLEKKLKRSYLALACMIIVATIMAVI